MRAYQKPEPRQVTAKQRGGRRTKETPNHRCWICDNHDRIATSTSALWERYRNLPFFGCTYRTRMAKRR